MYNKDYAILTVAYLKTKQHKNMAIKAFESMPKDVYKLCMVNANDINLDLHKYVDEVLENDENCLAKAWNDGLETLFSQYNYVLIPNLDVVFSEGLGDSLLSGLRGFDTLGGNRVGIVSATYSPSIGRIHEPVISRSFTSIQHGDGSFSCYMMSRDMFQEVGFFDENFKPAYFEDNDYLERAWAKNYKPMRSEGTGYWHYGQGTVKHDTELGSQYGAFMQRNLEYFKKKHNKVPDHLPSDIKFI